MVLTSSDRWQNDERGTIWTRSLGDSEDGRVRFRAWAPKAEAFELVIERSGAQERLDRNVSMMVIGNTSSWATGGDRYGYTVDGEDHFPTQVPVASGRVHG